MKIGLIDIDGHHYPNLPLMKLSAWHKAQGDLVEWYEPLFSGHCDRVYMSKVFSFTPDYEYCVDADEIIKGGSGYCIKLENGKEHYCAERDKPLPDEVEHIYPDYSIYPELTKDTAYGFLTRGCPRGCSFCHVAAKEGRKSRKVADLSEFWRGQKNIVLCDPNLIACPDWKELLQQLIDSKAWIDINQGIDIRLMTEEKAEMIRKLKVKNVHFAFDRYQDWDMVVPKLQKFAEVTGWKGQRWKVTVYILVNFDTTLEQDLQRIYAVRECGFQPFVMLYNKHLIPREHTLLKLQRWVNNPWVFWKCERFEDYEGKRRNKKIREEET